MSGGCLLARAVAMVRNFILTVLLEKTSVIDQDEREGRENRKRDGKGEADESKEVYIYKLYREINWVITHCRPDGAIGMT